MSRPTIEFDRVAFGYRSGSDVLRVEALRVEPGERILLRGPSGSGKSTLLNLAAGVATPTSGEVRLLGEPFSALSGAKRDRMRADHIGVVFQLFNLVPYLAVRENVLLSTRFSPLRRERLKGRESAEADRLLEALGMQGLGDRAAVELSVGEQQRCAVARALLGGPELLLADEPTSALDEDRREEFLRLLGEECTRSGTAVILSSHDARLMPFFDRTLTPEDWT